MDTGEILQYLQRHVLKGVNVDPDLMLPAINLAMLEIQRGVVINGMVAQHDWTAMEADLQMPYQYGGIALDAAITRVRALYRCETDSTTFQKTRGSFIQPTSTEARDNRRNDLSPPRFRDSANNTSTGLERWWVEGRNLLVGHDRQEFPREQSTNLSLWLDVYRMLPDLVNSTDANWFTTNMWDALAYKAAAVGFQPLFDAERIQFYEMKAAMGIQSAINSDERFADGGVSDDVVPEAPSPMPYERPNRWNYR